MKKKKTIALLLCMLMALSCLAVLAGCGGNNETAGESGSTTEVSSEASQETSTPEETSSEPEESSKTENTATADTAYVPDTLVGDWCFEDGSPAFSFNEDGTYKVVSMKYLGKFDDYRKGNYAVLDDGTLVLNEGITSFAEAESEKRCYDDYPEPYYLNEDKLIINEWDYYKKGGPTVESYSGNPDLTGTWREYNNDHGTWDDSNDRLLFDSSGALKYDTPRKTKIGKYELKSDGTLQISGTGDYDTSFNKVKSLSEFYKLYNDSDVQKDKSNLKAYYYLTDETLYMIKESIVANFVRLDNPVFKRYSAE